MQRIVNWNSLFSYITKNKRNLLVILFFLFIISGIILPKRKHDKDYLLRKEIKITKYQLERLKLFLINFYDVNKSYPCDIEELKNSTELKEYINERKGLIKEKHLFYDQWNEKFIYRLMEKNKVLLVSKGPDRIEDTSDDVKLMIN